MANIVFTAPMPSSQLGYHRQLAPNAAVKVSPLCLGAMGFGTSFKEMMGACDKQSSFEILDFFYKNGGNFIDTANVYHNGESESIIGEWMKSRDVREEIVLATKYSSAWRLSEQETKVQSNYGGNNKKSMRTAFYSSLEKLQTNYVDLFYVHTWDFTTSIPELMHSLHDLISSGQVLYLGISNTPAWIVSMANEYARNHGLTPFSVYQGQFSAAERDIERDILPMCNSQGMGFLPYGVLGSGYFRTSAQRAMEKANPERKRDGRNVSFVDKPQKIIVADSLEKIALDRGVHLTSVALAWARTKGPYVIPLVGGRTIEQLKQSIEALSLDLTKEEIKVIEESIPFDFGYPQTFLGGPGGATHPSDVWLTKRFGNFDWVAPEQPPNRHDRVA